MAHEEQKSRALAVIFGFCFLLTSGMSVLIFHGMWRENVKYSRYVETDCTIVSAGMIKTRKRSYHPSIEYTYIAAGETRRSWSYDDSNTYSMFQFRIDGLIKSFAAGSTMRCWVDPLDPTKSVIERPFPMRYGVNWVIVVMLTGMTAVFIFSTYNAWHDKSSC